MKWEQSQNISKRKQIYEKVHELLGDDSPLYQVVKRWSQHLKFERDPWEYKAGAGLLKNGWAHQFGPRYDLQEFIAESYGFSVWPVKKNSTRRIRA